MDAAHWTVAAGALDGGRSIAAPTKSGDAAAGRGQAQDVYYHVVPFHEEPQSAYGRLRPDVEVHDCCRVRGRFRALADGSDSIKGTDHDYFAVIKLC